MTEHKITESADKIVLKAEVKRGSGTRDQDKIKIKVKSDEATDAVETLEQIISKIDDSATELRDIQTE
jgi:DNA-directed RNA polymerase subunit L